MNNCQLFFVVDVNVNNYWKRCPTIEFIIIDLGFAERMGRFVVDVSVNNYHLGLVSCQCE